MRRITLEDVASMAADAGPELTKQASEFNRPIRIYLHWSAGHYWQSFPEYHINIDGAGNLSTDVLEFSERLDHTYMRNSGAIGVALLCGVNATPLNLGSEPPTEIQIETLGKVIATLCAALNIPIDYDHVRTHAEQADEQGYGPETTWEKWDLYVLPNVVCECGNYLRALASRYQ